MRSLVLYTSAYGSTKQYVEWIAEEANADIETIDEFNIDKFDEYDTIIIGTYVRVSKLVISDYLSKVWSKLKNKKVILFSVSKTPINSKASVKNYEKSIPVNIRSQIKYFPLEGRFIFEKLSEKDKNIMNLGRKMTRIFMGKKMAEEMVRDCDNVKKENIKEILNELKN
ncbi:flavodoxin domain-containing protein [Clostridium estertheticum]|uniref:flavodoxin domain-containing protein n=1 Tax=Clostridium estertheticum TaxID=238834 RepID=UPI0013EE4A85|nr:flavodoxin domain-containing protein [Clostridium estertheticum]MBZ9609073.1 flavodoxin domain-containing protein [Clostridium estertheticum]